MDVKYYSNLEKLKEFSVENNFKKIGTIWDFVIDKVSWDVKYAVVQTSQGIEDKSILINHNAFERPYHQKQVFNVSLWDRNGKEQKKTPKDIKSSPYVTNLEIVTEPPSEWSIMRSMHISPFPLPPSNSYYKKVDGFADQEKKECNIEEKISREIIGNRIYANDGKIGDIYSLVVNEEIKKIEYIIIDTGKVFPGRKVVLATRWLNLNNDKFFVDIPGNLIKKSPKYNTSVPFTRILENDVIDYYNNKLKDLNLKNGDLFVNESNEDSKLSTKPTVNFSESNYTIHELRSFDDFPNWTNPTDLASFLYESLKPYEDPLPVVRQAITDALNPSNREPGFVLIAEIDQKVVGALLMLRTGMKNYIPENFLLMVAVDPSTRGKGIGAKIIKRSFELVHGDVKLHVEYDNPAKRLYERLGMVSKYAEMRYSK